MSIQCKDQDPVREYRREVDERQLKRQKSLPGSEHGKTVGIVTLEEVEPVKAQDEADGTIHNINEQKERYDEIFENNIRIGNPHSHIEDGGIPLGVHVKEAEQGFRIHRIIYGGHIHKSALRENDVIIRIGDTNIGSLSIEEFKEFFWKLRLDSDSKIKVTIIRRVDDENEAEGGFVTQTFTIYLNVDDDKEEQQAVDETDCSNFLCHKPDKYYMTIQRNGQKMYLCVENDKPSFNFLGSDPKNPKYLWRMQLCQSSAIAQNFLLSNDENKKFLSCEDGDNGIKYLTMCDGSTMPTDATVTCDKRWFQRCDYDANGKFSLQSLQYQGWYLAVDPDTLQLKITQKASDRHFFVRHNV